MQRIQHWRLQQPKLIQLLKKLLHIPLLTALLLGVTLFFSCGPKKQVQTTNAEGDVLRESVEEFNSYFIDANTHFNNRNYETALKLFNKCIELKPNEAASYYQISRIYLQQKKLNEATLNAAKAVEFGPNNIYYSIWYAQLLRKSSKYREAIVVLENTYKSNKTDEVLVMSMDTAYIITDQINSAIDVWKNLIDNKGFQIRYGLRLISLYIYNSKFDEAHQVYNQIKQAAPKKHQYYIEDGNLYLKEKKEAEAMKNFETAIQLNPNNWDLNIALFNFNYKNKNYIKAKENLLLAFEDINTSFDKKTSFCSELIANFTTDSNYRAYVVISADQMLKYYIKNANALDITARMFEISKMNKKAYLVYLKACDLDPNKYEAWLGAINNSIEYQSIDTLVKTVDKALEYFPFTSGLYLKAAQYANRLNNWKTAEKYASRGINYAADDSTKLNFYLQLGLSEFKLKNFQKSIDYLENALKISNNNMLVLEHLGDALALNNDINKALIYWEKSKSVGNNSSQLMKKISEKKYSEQ
jgi:tetratricopeptide (TPR) repeat protein